jgi:hypothetical protein
METTLFAIYAGIEVVNDFYTGQIVTIVNNATVRYTARLHQPPLIALAYHRRPGDCRELR